MEDTSLDYLTIALPKGKLFGLSSALFAKIGYTAEGLTEKSRKLVIANEEKKSALSLREPPMFQPMWNMVQQILGLLARMCSWNPARMFMSCWILVWTLSFDDGCSRDTKARASDGLCSYEGSNEVSAYCWAFSIAKVCRWNISSWTARLSLARL